MTTENIGQQLKSARIKADISVEQLADKLCLSAGKVENLEENKFEDLAAPMYVVGYIRSYCKIVGTDPEPMIDAYQKTDVANEPELHTTSNQPAQINTKDPRFIIMTVALMIVLLALIVVWAWESLTPNLTQGFDAPEEKLPEIELVLADQPVETDVKASLNQEAPPSVLTEKLESTLSTLAVPVEGQSVSGEQEGNLEADGDKSTAEQILPIQAQNLGEQKKVNVQVEPSGRAPTGKDEVVITVKKPSWVNVRDANGYRLYYNMLNQAEEPLVLIGKAPFDVLLGDATTADVLYNQNEFEIKSYIRRDKSAKFRVK